MSGWLFLCCPFCQTLFVNNESDGTTNRALHQTLFLSLEEGDERGQTLRQIWSQLFQHCHHTKNQYNAEYTVLDAVAHVVILAVMTCDYLCQYGYDC